MDSCAFSFLLDSIVAGMLGWNLACLKNGRWHLKFLLHLSSIDPIYVGLLMAGTYVP